MPTQQLPQFAGLSSALDSTRRAGARFSGATSRFISDANTAISEQRGRFRGGLSAKVAQQTTGAQAGNSFASTLGNTTRVAKARQGIANRGEAALRNQQLRDRLAAAQIGLRKRGRGLRSLGDAANIRQGVNLAQSRADAAIDSSRADLLGGTLGAGAAFIKGKFEKDD